MNVGDVERYPACNHRVADGDSANPADDHADAGSLELDAADNLIDAVGDRCDPNDRECSSAERESHADFDRQHSDQLEDDPAAAQSGTAADLRLSAGAGCVADETGCEAGDDEEVPASTQVACGTNDRFVGGDEADGGRLEDSSAELQRFPGGCLHLTDGRRLIAGDSPAGAGNFHLNVAAGECDPAVAE